MIAIAEAPDRVLASSVLRSNATTSSPTPAQTVEAGPALASAGEYLSFRLADEEYGIDIQRVQEIRSYEPPTRIANAPDFIKGVVNLRGVIVPIVDLRIKLGCEADYNEFTVVIVLNIHERTVGAVVDSVSDVLALGHDQIKAAPEMNVDTQTTHITGIACLEVANTQRIMILLDIQSLMGSADMELKNSIDQ